MVLFHAWCESRMRISSVDTESRVVRFTGRTVFRLDHWEPHPRYYVENVLEELSSSGEWYLDWRRGRLWVWIDTPS